MGVTLKHMLNPQTVITKQYIGLKTPVGDNLLAKALGVTRDVAVQFEHKNCVICTMAKKLGMVEHEPTTDPLAVYERYYRPDDKSEHKRAAAAAAAARAAAPRAPAAAAGPAAPAAPGATAAKPPEKKPDDKKPDDKK